MSLSQLQQCSWELTLANRPGSPALREKKIPPPPSGPKGVVSLGLTHGFWNKVLPASVNHKLQARSNTAGFVWSTHLTSASKPHISPQAIPQKGAPLQFLASPRRIFLWSVAPQWQNVQPKTLFCRATYRTPTILKAPWRFKAVRKKTEPAFPQRMV